MECRNAGCGERVLLAKIEDHLKNECLQRLVKCNDCGKQILFSDIKVSVLTIFVQLAKSQKEFYCHIKLLLYRYMVIVALMLYEVVNTADKKCQPLRYCLLIVL